MAQSIRSGHLVKPKQYRLYLEKTLDLGMDFFRWEIQDVHGRRKDLYFIVTDDNENQYHSIEENDVIKHVQSKSHRFQDRRYTQGATMGRDADSYRRRCGAGAWHSFIDIARAAEIDLRNVWEAVFFFNPDVTEHQIIQELRLPRVLGGAMVGACFAVSGAIMQGMTRNPLADSGLLGLNAGAGFAIALCFPFSPYMYLILFSFLGAGLGAVLVYGVSSMAKGANAGTSRSCGSP